MLVFRGVCFGRIFLPRPLITPPPQRVRGRKFCTKNWDVWIDVALVLLALVGWFAIEGGLVIILLMEEIRLTSWYGKYPIIYMVLYIPGGCLGFLPSTVCNNITLSYEESLLRTLMPNMWSIIIKFADVCCNSHEYQVLVENQNGWTTDWDERISAAKHCQRWEEFFRGYCVEIWKVTGGGKHGCLPQFAREKVG